MNGKLTNAEIDRIFDAHNEAPTMTYRYLVARAIEELVASQRTREMRDALAELLDAWMTEMPSYETGEEAQNAWADRRAKARNGARDLLALSGQSAPWKGEWISVHDRVPAVGQEVLVFGQSPWEKAPSIKVDRWDEIHEAPVSFSSATVCVGEGWTENDSDEITHWRELPAAPLDRMQQSDEKRGEG